MTRGRCAPAAEMLGSASLRHTRWRARLAALANSEDRAASRLRRCSLRSPPRTRLSARGRCAARACESLGSRLRVRAARFEPPDSSAGASPWRRRAKRASPQRRRRAMIGVRERSEPRAPARGGSEAKPSISAAGAKRRHVIRGNRPMQEDPTSAGPQRRERASSAVWGSPASLEPHRIPPTHRRAKRDEDSDPPGGPSPASNPSDAPSSRAPTSPPYRTPRFCSLPANPIQFFESSRDGDCACA